MNKGRDCEQLRKCRHIQILPARHSSIVKHGIKMNQEGKPDKARCQFSPSIPSSKALEHSEADYPHK